MFIIYHLFIIIIKLIKIFERDKFTLIHTLDNALNWILEDNLTMKYNN